MVSKRAQQLIDAEIAARKLARRRWLAAALVIAVVGVIGWQTDRWLDVHVKKVHIEGELSPGERSAVMDTIADAIETSGAAGLHSLSLEQVQTAISGLSWADRVSARRRWPDTLVVRLMRHSVVARWGGGGFVASNGKVITPATTESQDTMDLPLLNCIESSSAKAMEVFNLLNRTLGTSGMRLVELNETELGGWIAGVARGSADEVAVVTEVTLGREDLAQRLQRFTTVEVAAEFERQSSTQGLGVAAVDARYHNGIAVRWSAGAQKSSAPLAHNPIHFTDAVAQLQESVH